LHTLSILKYAAGEKAVHRGFKTKKPCQPRGNSVGFIKINTDVNAVFLKVSAKILVRPKQ
jgi:hypothetical protein